MQNHTNSDQSLHCPSCRYWQEYLVAHTRSVKNYFCLNLHNNFIVAHCGRRGGSILTRICCLILEVDWEVSIRQRGWNIVLFLWLVVTTRLIGERTRRIHFGLSLNRSKREVLFVVSLFSLNEFLCLESPLLIWKWKWNHYVFFKNHASCALTTRRCLIWKPRKCLAWKLIREPRFDTEGQVEVITCRNLVVSSWWNTVSPCPVNKSFINVTHDKRRVVDSFVAGETTEWRCGWLSS